MLHRFSDCLQNMPVVLADSQSTLPQAQASELAADPSVTSHAGMLAASGFSDCLQSMPVVLADSTAASTGFRVGRIHFKVQGECLLHRFSDSCKTCQWCWQTRNPHCRKHRLQSWQKIRQSKDSRSIALHGPLFNYKTCYSCAQSSQSTHAGSQSGGWLKLSAP